MKKGNYGSQPAFKMAYNDLHWLILVPLLSPSPYYIRLTCVTIKT